MVTTNLRVIGLMTLLDQAEQWILPELLQTAHLDEREYAVLPKLLEALNITFQITTLSDRECGKEYFSFPPFTTYTYFLPSVTTVFFCSSSRTCHACLRLHPVHINLASIIRFLFYHVTNRSTEISLESWWSWVCGDSVKLASKRKYFALLGVVSRSTRVKYYCRVRER